MRIRIPKSGGISDTQEPGAGRAHSEWLDNQFLSKQRLDTRYLGRPLPRWNAAVVARPAQSPADAEAAPALHEAAPGDDALQGGVASRAEGLALSGNERWFLVYTLPKRELQAAMRLRIQGFRVYVPQYLRTTRHARQLRTCRAPLFPRYLFVILDLERDRWLCVRGTVGVSSLVGHEERPMPVPYGITEALIAQADGNGLIQFGDGLRAGQKVRIASGPFADLVGTLERFDDTGRVRLLLDMMGSEIAITLPRSGILPAA